MRPDTTKKSLQTKYAPETMAQIAHELAAAVNAVEELRGAKKAADADFKGQIDKREEEVAGLARRYAKGHEFTEIDCDIRYNDPEPGKKSIFRMDTRELVETADMTWEEKQDELQFNLPKETPGAEELENALGDITPCDHPTVTQIEGGHYQCDQCKEILDEKPGSEEQADGAGTGA